MGFILLIACTGTSVIHTYLPVPEKGWDRSDTMTFAIPQTTPQGVYYMDIGLRINNRFPYRQLVMVVERTMENPAEFHRDTITYQLTDERNNLMEGGVNLYQYETESLPITLQRGQGGRVSIRHIMRKETIPSISDIGIHIRK